MLKHIVLNKIADIIQATFSQRILLEEVFRTVIQISMSFVPNDTFNNQLTLAKKILVPNSCQAIIWTNDYLVTDAYVRHRRYLTKLSPDDCLMCARSSSFLNGTSILENPRTKSARDHDDVIKWKHFLRYWPLNSPHKGQWRGALMFSLICARINSWVNNGEAGDLGHNRAHYDVTVMLNWQMVGILCTNLVQGRLIAFSWYRNWSSPL